MDTPQLPPPAPMIPTVSISDALQALNKDNQSELDKVLALILDPKHIQHFTELTNNQILAISVLTTIANKYRKLILYDWLMECLKLRVSKDRKGRGELVKLVTRELAIQQHMQMPMAPQRRGFWRR